MKQTIVIQRKTFNFELVYFGNARILKITERRKGFVASICFNVSLMSWFCSVIDQACRESNQPSFYQSKDDGNKLIIIRGRSNDQGKFLKVFEILRNDK